MKITCNKRSWVPESVDSDNYVAYQWSSLIQELENDGYIVDKQYRSKPADFITMRKGNKVYEAPVNTNAYNDGAYEIVRDQILWVDDQPDSVSECNKVTAAYYNDYSYEDDDAPYTDYDGNSSGMHTAEYEWINDAVGQDDELISIYEYVGNDYTKDQFVCVDSSVPPTEINEDVIEWSGDSLEDAVTWAHGGEYTKLDTKNVLDSDGFSTEYTMYEYNGDDSSKFKFIFMFGDTDLYEPNEDYADWACDTREEAIAWFNDYRGPGEDDDIYTATNIQASEYWYFTKHGVQPGSVPKGYNILDIVDTETGSYFLTDKVIPGDALVEFDIIEKVPENR